jgi:hypothetical protein
MEASQKKLFAVIGVVVVAIAVAVFSFVQFGVGGPQVRVVGTLEEGINRETGLPLDPPPAGQVAAPGAADATARPDPSMPGG